ncbi:MAG TPA: TetR family transcriptional regulator, partial [Acidimicrobiales bacterium]|nr:TetR family transcriptional regulator [Acidimicrobiales bacterium]
MKASGTRRAPAPEERQVDAERTKAALIDAALEEFAAKGFAGATVRDIAERAGVSKDLIAYHFGGKEGLFEAVQTEWLARRDAFVDHSAPLATNLASYLHSILSDPRPLRLLVWRGLLVDDNSPETSPDIYPEVSHLGERQRRGELSNSVDPGVLNLVLMGAVAAPVIFPDQVRRVFGLAISDEEFEDRYLSGLLTVLRAGAI